jgi:hypothetical protein
MGRERERERMIKRDLNPKLIVSPLGPTTLGFTPFVLITHYFHSQSMEKGNPYLWGVEIFS